ncbi:MAG: type II toxin-antitoxin system RelE/ParE family toxin, partial [Desulfobulbaceae bacterium]|nr:type II toxin-antitoxin system RelE/ParE family toxin [Desulfobulbaceae bacterium]
LTFTDEIDSTIERIQLNPDFYQRVTENIRKIQVNKFPYSVYYTTEDDTLVILRIFHNKRKPLTW